MALGGNFQPHRTLACNNKIIFIRTHQRPAVFRGKILGDRCTVFRSPIIADYVGTFLSRASELNCGRILGHDDCCRCAEHAGGRGYSACMIARRIGNYALFPLFGCELA